MSTVKTRLLVRAAMFAALTMAATYIIRIPMVATGGYIHPGDAFVILSGIILGPVYGAAAAGIGSALCDILAGYAFYAPVTLIIKGLVAFISGHIYYRAVFNRFDGRKRCLMAGFCAVAVIPAGYLIFEYAVYGPVALTNIIPNLIQAGSGLIISNLLYAPLKRFADYEKVDG